MSKSPSLTQANHVSHGRITRGIGARSNYSEHLVRREEAYAKALAKYNKSEGRSMPLWGEPSQPDKDLCAFNINRLEEYFTKNLEIYQKTNNYRPLRMMFEDLYRYSSRGGATLKNNHIAAKYASSLEFTNEFQKYIIEDSNGTNRILQGLKALIEIAKKPESKKQLESSVQSLPILIGPLLAVMINPDLCTEEQKTYLDLPLKSHDIKTILGSLRSLTTQHSRTIFNLS